MTRGSRIEIVLITVIVLVASIGVRIAYQPGDAVAPIERAESLYHLDLGEPHPWFTAWAMGDGQAYALIAADASGQKLADNVHEATYRFARAGHGWVAAVFSFGQEDLIPYGLAITGALAIVGVLVATVLLRNRLGPKAWIILMNPAIYRGFGGDTSEPLGILLLVIAMGWTSWAAAALLGVTRPTFLVGVWGRWRLFLPGAAAAVALATYSLLAFGTDPFLPDGGRIGLPLASYIEHLSLWGVVLAIAAFVTMVIGVKNRNWGWVIAGFFILCFGSDVLRAPANAWRAAGFLPVMWAFGPRYRAVSELEPEADTPLPVDA